MLIPRYSPIKRTAPPRKRRKGLRRGELTKAQKHVIRLAVFERAQGICELQLHKQCSGRRVLPFDGDVFERGHLVHLRSRGAGGTWEMDNLVLGCSACHCGSLHMEGKRWSTT